MTRLVVSLIVLEIFNNESVNSTFKYKLEYKLGGFNTWELVLDTEIKKIWWNSGDRDLGGRKILVW